MKTFFLHLFTGKDNATADVGRLLWAFGVVGFVAFAGWYVFHGGEFDAQNYGIGLGAALGGGGAAIGFKAGTEP